MPKVVQNVESLLITCREKSFLRKTVVDDLLLVCCISFTFFAHPFAYLKENAYVCRKM